MELTSELIAIQGILSSLIKQTGEFTKINYRGGNEDKILDVMVEIQKFISHPDRGYMKDEKIVEKYDRQLQDIVIFLSLNTVFKRTLELPEHSHLMNITPPLSKCLFVNVVYGLDLCKYYCKVIELFPLEFSTELLEETIPCLKKSIPKVHLDNAYIFLKAAAIKLASIDYNLKVEDNVDNISEVTRIILQNLSGMYSDQIKNMKAVQIYQHMGYCLLYLFELLLYCNKDCLSLKKFVRNVFRTCCTLVRNVTINVFCAWAEIKEEDEALQNIISSRAYLVTEKYQKQDEAKELISMLGPIARKPLTLTELIHKADVPTMIKKINKVDQNQKNWFKALLATNIFKDEEAVKCVEKWCQLCSEDDVSLLLDSCVDTKNLRHKKLAIKCVATLPTENLILVAVRHFYKHKFVNMISEGIEEALALMFNKLGDKGSARAEELTADLILLLFQSPELVLGFIYTECLKNAFYTACLKPTFLAIHEIGKINNIGVSVLLGVVEKNIPNSQNVNKYVELFRVLVETGYFSNDMVLLKVLYPLVKRFYEGNSLEELSCTLQIILGGNITIYVLNETKAVVILLLTIMNGYRRRFLNFDGVKQEIVRYIVDIFCDGCRRNVSSEVDIIIDGEDGFTGYYRKYLTCMGSSFFRNMCPEFDINNYGKCVNQMLQILPPSVTREWLLTAEGIIELSGNDKCMELFTDVMILLAQLVETQKDEDSKQLSLAMKYCIQNFGIVLQQRIQHNSTIDTETNVDRQVCRLLAKLPNALKEEEGLSLINILTDRSLKSLANDKEFLCHLILIRNAKICQVLAQKITNS
ncbi:hypothetical protein JTB14_023492 [Gonioctena quinquepunctata]|nr:hypothetical protein JTB14_023492 [Gonioctena quinquepunctata]